MKRIGSPTSLDIQFAGRISHPGIVNGGIGRDSQAFETQAKNAQGQSNKIAESIIIAGQKIHRLTLNSPPKGSDFSILFPLENIGVGLDGQVQLAELLVRRPHQ